MAGKAKRPVKRKKPEENNGEEKKQDYYADIFDEAEKRDFALAREVDGIDEEIALLRTEIKKVISGEGNLTTLRAIAQAVNALEKLVRTRYVINKDQKGSLKKSIGIVLREVAIPFGVKLGAEYLGRKFG